MADQGPEPQVKRIPPEGITDHNTWLKLELMREGGKIDPGYYASAIAALKGKIPAPDWMAGLADWDMGGLPEGVASTIGAERIHDADAANSIESVLNAQFGQPSFGVRGSVSQPRPFTNQGNKWPK